VLENLHVQAQLYVVADGEAALAFMHREGLHAATIRPDFVLLDLNPPQKPSLEDLTELSLDPSLRRISLILLSSSQAERAPCRAISWALTVTLQRSPSWSSYSKPYA
jgi:CheY-like chemotaxis protein